MELTTRSQRNHGKWKEWSAKITALLKTYPEKVVYVPTLDAAEADKVEKKILFFQVPCTSERVLEPYRGLDLQSQRRREIENGSKRRVIGINIKFKQK